MRCGCFHHNYSIWEHFLWHESPYKSTNRSMAGLGSPGPSRFDLICNRATVISLFDSINFFNLSVVNFIHNSTVHILMVIRQLHSLFNVQFIAKYFIFF